MLTVGMSILPDAADLSSGFAASVDFTPFIFEFQCIIESSLRQTGSNLLRIGILTVLSETAITHQSTIAMFATTVVNWSTAIGVFASLDLSGFVNAVPATVITVFSSAAVVLSVWVSIRGTLRKVALMRGAKSRVTGVRDMNGWAHMGRAKQCNLENG